jgi:Zn-finger nucleic acid-binding protein
MEERSVAEALVDVCTTCQGVWIEWFDGQIVEIARTVPPPSHAPVPRLGPQKGVCPTCQQKLTREEVGGVSITRCGECAGAFVSREAIAVLGATDIPAPPESRTLFARLALQLRSWFPG